MYGCCLHHFVHNCVFNLVKFLSISARKRHEKSQNTTENIVTLLEMVMKTVSKYKKKTSKTIKKKQHKRQRPTTKK